MRKGPRASQWERGRGVGLRLALELRDSNPFFLSESTCPNGSNVFAKLALMAQFDLARATEHVVEFHDFVLVAGEVIESLQIDTNGHQSESG